MKGIFEHVWKMRDRINKTYWSITQNQDVKLWLQNKDHVMSKWWKKGIVDIDDVLHGFKNPKSRTLKWFGLDNAQTFKSLGDHHGFTADNVNYTFNAHGFRGDEIEQESDFTVLVVGCSHTFGIGLDDKQYWPHHLKNMLAEDYKNPKVINLSCPGGSNDWIARATATSIDKIKPDLVVVVWTYPNRREAIWDSGLLWQLNTELPGGPEAEKHKLEFQSHFMTINEHSDHYNWMRNHWLVTLACKDTMLIESHVTDLHMMQNNLTKILGYNDVARDNKHFGPKVHQHYADKIYWMFKYRQKQKKSVK